MLVKHSYVLFLLSLFLLGCEQDTPVIAEPSRPSNVPAASVWVGGVDGGVFVLVNKSKSQDNDEYFSEIYYVSGDLSYKGSMKIFPPGSPGFETTNKESFRGWDGDTLYLKNNQYLKIQN